MAPTLELDLIEMYRIDNDGIPSYSPMEILNGEIIIPNSETGYWDSDNCEEYANPLLVKLTRVIWNDYPEFIFLGECSLEEKYSKRKTSLVKSGIIPRMYTFPGVICQILGKKIKNGKLESIPPENVSKIKKWYNENYQNLPEGAILVQGLCGRGWPYPSILYERGTLIAIDLLFTLPDIPMTFMNEIDGDIYKVAITNIYENGGRSIDAQNLDQNLKNDYILDLTKIKNRYEQRRKMRQDHNCLKKGEIIFLDVYDNNNKIIPGILAFARKTPEETAIFAINFRDQETNFYLDLSSLLGKYSNSNYKLTIEDWTNDNKGENYKMKEITVNHIMRKIAPYGTVYLGFSAETVSIRFTSMNQYINNHILRWITADNFTEVETALFTIYPYFKTKQNHYLLKGKKIDKNKSLEENNIEDNDNILIYTFDE